MTNQGQLAAPPVRRPLRRWADKRQAIMGAARTVFGRDGYTRASIDAVASMAGVSTRTIYNHFGDKERLFLDVIEQSATQVAEIQIGLVGRYLGTITDLEQDLITFGVVWATFTTDYAEHFALVRQINAEVGHIPTGTLDAWQETGPRRVHYELARRMQDLADQGVLRANDPDRTASHLVLLTATEVTSRSYYGAIPLDESEVIRIVTSGVRAFLHGYLPRLADSQASVPSVRR